MILTAIDFYIIYKAVYGYLVLWYFSSLSMIIIMMFKAVLWIFYDYLNR